MIKKITELLQKREFISVATSDLSGKPNAAPKFLLKVENNLIFLIDYTQGKTWENLKKNPRVSLSFMDTESLTGYQINGGVKIIDKGSAYDKIFNELLQKEIDLSCRRIIEGVVHEKGHKSFEVAIPDRVVIFKIEIEEIAEIDHRGEIRKENYKS